MAPQRDGLVMQKEIPTGGLRAVSPVDLLHFATFALLLALTPLAMGRIDAGWWLPFGLASVVGAILTLAWAHGLRPTSRVLDAIRLWYPVATVTLVFWSLYYFIPAVNPHGYQDAALYEIDRRMLGFDPIAWVRTFEHPLLTDFMHVLYLVYFFLPVILIVALLRKRDRGALSEAIFVLCLGFFLCYVGYALVPAEGPRFFIYGSNRMEGLFLTQGLRDAIDALEPSKADAFPSAHAALTLVVNGLAFRYARRLGLILLPITAGILLSLVYARYHYVIDVLAGFGFAAVTLLVGIRLHRRLLMIVRPGSPVHG